RRARPGSWTERSTLGPKASWMGAAERYELGSGGHGDALSASRLRATDLRSEPVVVRGDWSAPVARSERARPCRSVPNQKRVCWQSTDLGSGHAAGPLRPIWSGPVAIRAGFLGQNSSSPALPSLLGRRSRTAKVR